MRRHQWALAFVWVCFLPVASWAQGSIAGLVKDASGAVLPGVTVEAASPVLIEKSRSVITDGTGRYRVVDLRPGNYTVTFTLTGFNTVKREGIELTGSFTATVDVDMRVGALEETVTVTAAASTVDLQNTRRQQVMNTEVIDALPTARNHNSLAVLVPGVLITSVGTSSPSTQDVGGSLAPSTYEMTVHGSKTDSQKITQNGVSLSTLIGGGTRAQAEPTGTSVQEVTIDTAATSAEMATGGVTINFIPKEGGNAYKGTIFGSFANDSMEWTNLTQDLQNRGLLTPTKMKSVWDFNPGLGGPLKKDKAWFYLAVRRNRVGNWAGVFRNKNENNPNAWTYVPDLDRPAANIADNSVANLRLTWQATPRNKVGFTADVENLCNCPDRAGSAGVGTSRAPEAGFGRAFPLQRFEQADWKAPITNRFLFEVSASQRSEGLSFYPSLGPDRSEPINPAMIAVTEQSTGMTYRAFATYTQNFGQVVYYRAAVSYVTGSHSWKVGFHDGFGTAGPQTSFNLDSQTAYRFNNGVPNQVTIYATPYAFVQHVDHDLGVYAQDRWTVNHLTVTGGVRFDYFANHFPEQHLGPSRFTPTRDFTFPELDNMSWKDISPRAGAVYDLFGDGKTAVKVSLNKYLQGVGAGAPASPASARNPVNAVVQNTTRSWNDSFFPVGDPRRGNFTPDCDLINPLANNECGAMANANFGKAVASTTYDPDVITGWGKRQYNWEFSAGVQHELAPGVSVDVSYFQRWYGKFLVTDNTLVNSSDYTTFSLVAPVDSRLPGGGGNTITGIVDLNPAKVGQVANYVTFSDKFGEQTDHWKGVDVIVNARLHNGVLLQGGLSMGREVADNCAIVAALPELQFGATNFLNTDAGITPLQYCHQAQNLLAQLKMLGVYTVPRVNIQVSATLQSQPGIQRSAAWVVPNAAIAPSLGRSLSGGAASATINLVNPGTLYGDRVNQLDLRLLKSVKVGRIRTNLMLDIYNALNQNTVLQENFAFANWQVPTQILTPRFAKVGVQLDF